MNYFVTSPELIFFSNSYYNFLNLFPIIFVIFYLNSQVFLKISNWFIHVIVFKSFILSAIVFAIKFLILISILIFIRGGVPRYRYDFLTKIGWVKFLSLTLSLLLIQFLGIYIFS